MGDDIRERVAGLVTDLVAAFLYYDRKDDEETPVGMIEVLIHDGEITEDQIVAEFAKALHFGVTERR